MLRVGRINSRSLDGPVRLPDKYREQVEAVENIYDAWFRIWHESYLPKLICKPKWFKTDEDLQECDLVYFMKSESKLSNEYTMGRVDHVIAGKDVLLFFIQSCFHDLNICMFLSSSYLLHNHKMWLWCYM